MGGGAEKGKYGEMLPNIIRVIICGPNCGKTNILIGLLKARMALFEKVYVYLKSL